VASPTADGFAASLLLPDWANAMDCEMDAMQSRRMLSENKLASLNRRGLRLNTDSQTGFEFK
jgi:hypothetical protein